MSSPPFVRHVVGGGRGRSVEWETPPDILEKLGPFDDDPCKPGLTDGLRRDWSGFVWLNPPYGPDMWPWLEKLAAHEEGGIALIFARTETKGFYREVWAKCSGLLFYRGRPHFYRNGVKASANCGGPVVFVAYGPKAAKRLESCELPGAYVESARIRI